MARAAGHDRSSEPLGAAVSHLLRRGAYCDSIVLLELQKALLALPGVEDAGAVMATGTNLDLLAVRGLLPAGLADVAPDDLLVVVRAATEELARAALAETDPLLTRRRGEAGGDYRPRSLGAAARLNGVNDAFVQPCLQCEGLVREPFVLRRPPPRREEDGHFVEARRQRRLEAHVLAELLRPVPHLGAAQQHVEGTGHRAA